MNRRHFTQLSALAFAGSRLPAQAATQTAPPIRYAVIGLGTISSIFIRACAASQGAKVTALVTGHPETKGKNFAARLGISESSVYTYEIFDRIRDNPNVDAVYIGLPNSMHCDLTVRAAAAGKHVFCEKPMAISIAECHTMIDACRKANVKLMIGYRIHFEPTWKKAEEIIKSGGIGQIQAFDGGFSGQQPAGAWRLNRKLAGGGSIMDLGIYPLNAIRHLTGEEPSAITAIAATRETSGRFSQVEQSIMWTMKFPSGILATCNSSYGQANTGYFRISGDRGQLEFNPAFGYNGMRLVGFTDRQEINIAGTEQGPYQFTLEADYFADCIRNNRHPEPDGEEGLKDLIAINAIYRTAGSPLG